MPQNAIFIEGNTSAVFIESNIKTSIDIVKLKKYLIKVYEMNSDQLLVLMSFSKSGLKKLGVVAPNCLVDFEELVGLKNLKMPS